LRPYIATLLYHRQEIFLIITVAAVVTNAGLAIFTMQGLDYLDTTTRYKH